MLRFSTPRDTSHCVLSNVLVINLDAKDGDVGSSPPSSTDHQPPRHGITRHYEDKTREEALGREGQKTAEKMVRLEHTCYEVQRAVT